MQDPHNRRGERGPSNWDAGHIFTMDFSYTLPAPRHRRGSGFVSGWQIAVTGRASTGRPFTPRTSTTNLNLGGAIRPDRIAKGTLPDRTPDRWFDLSAFPPVPVGTLGYGNSGRNILDDPGDAGIKLSVIKNTRWRE